MLSKRSILWLKLGRTLNCNLGCFAMGLVMALTGVALLDLVEIYESDIKTVSHFITARCIAELAGSLIGHKTKQPSFCFLLSISYFFLIAPLCTLICGFFNLVGDTKKLWGVTNRGVPTFSNVWVIRLWPENSSPALQVYHLSFGVGCLVAPLLAEPFLSTIAPSDLSTSDPAFNDTSFFLNNGSLNSWNQTQNVSRTESHIQYAFGITSGIYMIPLVSMIALYIIDNSDFKPEKTTPSEDSTGEKEAAENARYKVILLTLLWAYVCFYIALESTPGQMMAAYAVKSDLHLTKSSASHLTAVYFSCFAASRIIAAVVAIKVTSFQMLVASHVLIAVSATLLLIWGSSLEVMLWVCAAFLGLGKGPVYGAIVAWTAAYIEMTNSMMSLIIVAAVVGALSPPLLV
ncbi:unnamed protein product, partial [Ixodes hexagonus]